MPSPLQDVYCCCNVFPVTYGIYLIAFHCLLQGMYGIGVVVTSTHIQLFYIINLLVTLSHSLLIPGGIAVLWTNLYQSWKGARVSAIFLFSVSLANLATALLYFIFYLRFKANSLLDKMLFWVGTSDWVDGRDYPFIFWHLQIFILILTAPLWWYYAYVLYKYSKLIKSNRGKKIRLRLPKHKTRNKRLRKLTLSRKKYRKPKEPEKRDETTETIVIEPQKPRPIRPENVMQEQNRPQTSRRDPSEMKEAKKMIKTKEEELL